MPLQGIKANAVLFGTAFLLGRVAWGPWLWESGSPYGHQTDPRQKEEGVRKMVKKNDSARALRRL